MDRVGELRELLKELPDDAEIFPHLGASMEDYLKVSRKLTFHASYYKRGDDVNQLHIFIDVDDTNPEPTDEVWAIGFIE